MGMRSAGSAERMATGHWVRGNILQYSCVKRSACTNICWEDCCETEGRWQEKCDMPFQGRKQKSQR